MNGKSEQRPLTIYLDSSDYSHLTEDQHQDKFDALLQLKNSGLAIFRYSAVTIYELVHTKPEHQKYGVKRALVLKQLCGNRVLHHYEDLIYKDCIHQLLGLRGNTDYAHNDDGIYYPEDVDNFYDFDIEVAKIAKERCQLEISKITDSATRRELKSQLKKAFKAERFSTQGLSFLRGISQSIAERYPSPNSADLARLITHLFERKITRAEFAIEFTKQILDPFHLTTCPPEQAAHVISHCQWMREMAPKFLNMVEDLRRLFLRYEQLTKQNDNQVKKQAILASLPSDLPRVRQGLISKCWRNRADDFRRVGITHKKFSTLHESPDGAIPSVDVVVKILEEYLRQMMLNERRSLKASDLGDLIHSIYLPYVDVFRTDATMANFYRPIAKQYGTSVISSLEDLVETLHSHATFL